MRGRVRTLGKLTRRHLQIERRLAHAGWPAATTSDGFPKHHADRVEITASVDLVASGLLGGHVGQLAFDDTRGGVHRRGGRLGNTEVEQLDLPVISHENILRRNVAMHDGERSSVVVDQTVGILKALEHIEQNAGMQRELERRPVLAKLGQGGVQRDAIEILHRHQVAERIHPDIVGLNDVRVIEARREPRFVEEHLNEIGIDGELGAELLDDRELAETRSPRPSRPRKQWPYRPGRARR